MKTGWKGELKMIKKIILLLLIICILTTGAVILADTASRSRNADRDKNSSRLAQRDEASTVQRPVRSRAEREAVKNDNAVNTPLEDRLTKRAESLGIDTTGLTEEEIREKILEVVKAQCPLNEEERLLKRAETLGIDPSGLTLEELREKILGVLRPQTADKKRIDRPIAERPATERSKEDKPIRTRASN